MIMSKKRTLGLVVTDGVGFRNFILSNFLCAAQKEYDRVIIFSGLPSYVYDGFKSSKVEVEELPVFQESFRNWFMRKTKETAHLRLHRSNFGINDNLNANRAASWSNRGIATRFLYGLTKFIHSEAFVQVIEGLQENAIARPVMEKFQELLFKAAPDILLFTHQRPPYVLPLLSAAKRTKTPTCSFIFSWDNLSSKGRMAGAFGNYLVWSELMKKDLLHFYPKVKDSEVEVVGTPQFEPYIMDKYHLQREQFFENLDLIGEFKTICYSCGDSSTSRNDELYIQTIAKAIEGRKLNHQVNFIVRTSPAEEPERFAPLRSKYSFIKWNIPKWKISRSDHPEEWSQRFSSEQDVIDLKGLLQFCDLNINMCSTMTLDFLIFDKPVINPVFGNEENGLYNDQRFLRYDHYRRVAESGAVKIATNEEELISGINASLDDPSIDAKARKELLRLQISEPLEETSSRILAAVKRFSAIGG